MARKWPIMGALFFCCDAPEPAVAHAKSTFGPESPVLPGDNAKRPTDSDFATKYKKQRLWVTDLLKLPRGSWCNVDALMNFEL
jgi:hypothetical protein